MRAHPDVLAPCGLFCGICLDNVVNMWCHGCGCDCGSCAGVPHAENCAIAQCATGKGFETCAECDDMPCMDLILFTFHPIAAHHLPSIEVLRRVQRVGKEQVLAELRERFADSESRLRWAWVESTCEERQAAFERWRASLAE